jgi:hypothetical protein
MPHLLYLSVVNGGSIFSVLCFVCEMPFLFVCLGNILYFSLFFSVVSKCGPLVVAAVNQGVHFAFLGWGAEYILIWLMLY